MAKLAGCNPNAGGDHQSPSGSKVFSKLDSKHGYWLIKLDEESSKFKTFNSPIWRFRFKRLSHWMHSSSAWIRSSVSAHASSGSPMMSLSTGRMTRTTTKTSITSWRSPGNVDLSSTLRSASSRRSRSSSLGWSTMLTRPWPWPWQVCWNPGHTHPKDCHGNPSVSAHQPVHVPLHPQICWSNSTSDSPDQERSAIWVEQLPTEGFRKRQSLHLQGHCPLLLQCHQTNCHSSWHIKSRNRCSPSPRRKTNSICQHGLDRPSSATPTLNVNSWLSSLAVNTSTCTSTGNPLWWKLPTNLWK